MSFRNAYREKLAIVPILRIGLGMLDGILSLVLSAKVGHIDIYRDQEMYEAHPDIQIYAGHIDRELNKKVYICLGLGDVDDRIFGTK